MKAAPLLRRWVQRLRGLGVQFAMHHRWTGLRAGKRWQVEFEPRVVEVDAVILALGGGSWPETGSDGGWAKTFEQLGVSVAPLVAANCGWEIPWPAEVIGMEGQPLKNIVARVGETEAHGELLITRYGLEGGAIYQLGSALRLMHEPELSIDFKPALSAAELAEKLAPSQRVSLLEAARRWRLSEATLAILRTVAPPLGSPMELAELVKCCRVRLTAPRPIAEAISSAGGVRWEELDDSLMLRKLPGVFVAGEMIDWEAPTGGYLIQGCFATGTRAGRAAVDWLERR
jgi:uncharacterized flavoprotein (TIGR03862 family)